MSSSPTGPRSDKQATTSSSEAHGIFSVLSVGHNPSHSTTKAAMFAIRLVFQSLAMYIVPKTIHGSVQCIGAIEELLGRRARSKFDRIPWMQISVGVLLLFAWQIVLIRVSYQAVLDEPLLPENEEQSTNVHVQEKAIGRKAEKADKTISWGRVLGRLVVPGFILIFLTIWGIRIALMTINPKPLMVENDVAPSDASNLG